MSVFAEPPHWSGDRSAAVEDEALSQVAVILALRVLMGTPWDGVWTELVVGRLQDRPVLIEGSTNGLIRIEYGERSARRAAMYVPGYRADLSEVWQSLMDDAVYGEVGDWSAADELDPAPDWGDRFDSPDGLELLRGLVVDLARVERFTLAAKTQNGRLLLARRAAGEVGPRRFLPVDPPAEVRMYSLSELVEEESYPDPHQPYREMSARLREQNISLAREHGEIDRKIGVARRATAGPWVEPGRAIFEALVEGIHCVECGRRLGRGDRFWRHVYVRDDGGYVTHGPGAAIACLGCGGEPGEIHGTERLSSVEQLRPEIVAGLQEDLDPRRWQTAPAFLGALLKAREQGEPGWVRFPDLADDLAVSGSTVSRYANDLRDWGSERLGVQLLELRSETGQPVTGDDRCEAVRLTEQGARAIAL